ncbi:MAG TPA: proline dehydrogenase family protein [Vicinamibacterales bacterium]
MLDSASKAFFHLLAQSKILKTLGSRYGMRRKSSFARRFIAGEEVQEAIEAARTVEARGLMHTLDLLGESVATLDEAYAATRQYLEVIDAIAKSSIGRGISLKLTQLGLDVDKATAVDNLRRILERAEPADFFIRVDMENSPYTDVTLEIFETMWQQGYRQLGVVLQSALYRSEKDLARMNAIGASVRLVKGAYKEPKTVAYQRKADVDAAYLRMAKTLLVEGQQPAIATHDVAMIDAIKQWAREENITADRFEFQMLYGIRRDLQARLVKDGYRVRVYIPFGREWFPYFMRRLGERPANVLFVARGILGEGD